MMSSSEEVSSERLAASSQRLCRPDVRKGSAFPEACPSGLSEATPRQSQQGVASQFGNSQPRSNASLSPRLILLLLTAYCLLLTSACRRDMQDQPTSLPD